MTVIFHVICKQSKPQRYSVWKRDHLERKSPPHLEVVLKVKLYGINNNRGLVRMVEAPSNHGAGDKDDYWLGGNSRRRCLAYTNIHMKNRTTPELSLIMFPAINHRNSKLLSYDSMYTRLYICIRVIIVLSLLSLLAFISLDSQMDFELQNKTLISRKYSHILGRD